MVMVLAFERCTQRDQTKLPGRGRPDTWVDERLEAGDERQNQQRVDDLHLIWQQQPAANFAVHLRGLQSPAGALKNSGDGHSPTIASHSIDTAY